jgi:hypothetical protein
MQQHAAADSKLTKRAKNMHDSLKNGGEIL